MNLKLASITLAAAALVLTPAALAGTANDTLTASATVTNSCNISVTGQLAFSTFNPLGSAANTTGTVNVKCTNGATSDVIMPLSTNATVGGQRRMLSGTVDFLNYTISDVSSGGALWASTGAGVPITSDGSAHDYTIYGQIPASQTGVKAGSYSDTVAVTVNF